MSEHAPPREPTPFEKMAALASKVISVPKSEIERRERERKEAKPRSLPKHGDAST